LEEGRNRKTTKQEFSPMDFQKDFKVKTKGQYL